MIVHARQNQAKSRQKTAIYAKCSSLGVSWIAKKTNEWVLNKAGVKRELLDTVKASYRTMVTP